MTRFDPFGKEARLPVSSDAAETVRRGGLISYGPLLSDHFVLGAAYVDKILKGAKPGDLPVEQPTRYELFVNLRTAIAWPRPAAISAAAGRQGHSMRRTPRLRRVAALMREQLIRYVSRSAYRSELVNNEATYEAFIGAAASNRYPPNAARLRPASGGSPGGRARLGWQR